MASPTFKVSAKGMTGNLGGKGGMGNRKRWWEWIRRIGCRKVKRNVSKWGSKRNILGHYLKSKIILLCQMRASFSRNWFFL